MAVVYCFGDSITYGAWDIRGGGWSARLRNYLDDLQEKDESLYFLSYNLGIPGETTDGLVKRFTHELNAREREGEEAIFIFAFGANDSVFMSGKNEFRVPKDRFVSNLQSILDQAMRISKKIILLNITPVDEALCASRYEGKDKLRLNENIEEYNALIVGLAQKSGILLVDVYSAYTNVNYKDLLSEDGLHPNEKGHQLIFEKIKQAITPLVS